MGQCASNDGQIPPHPLGDIALRQRNQAINKQIDHDARTYRKEIKILLLGSGESGKSTVVKQMKIIHQGGYTRDELFLARNAIFQNILESAQALIFAMVKFGLEPEIPENKEYAEKIMEYKFESEIITLLPTGGTTISKSDAPYSSYGNHSTPGKNKQDGQNGKDGHDEEESEEAVEQKKDAQNQYTLSRDIVEAIESLWHDPIIPVLLDKQSQFYLMDSAPYFFSHIQRIAKTNYIPSMDDYLYARTKTTGISETHFSSGPLSIHMFDVGGQRSERKKWIHCFEMVTSIIFCVALSEYDQVLLEETNTNRMDESLLLFESVINSRWFIRTSIILFLNKIDIFRDKLPRVPLTKYYPEYSGGCDVIKASKYLLWKFNQLNRAKLSMYPHLTQATDTSNIRLVFVAVKETILQNALKDSGIL